MGTANDYEDDYLYDLVGNRLEKHTDKGLDRTIDEKVKSTFDRNARYPEMLPTKDRRPWKTRKRNQRQVRRHLAGHLMAKN